MNPDLAKLQPYPFQRLRTLFHGVTPAADFTPINLSIGEPKHATPALIRDALIENLDGLASYPLTQGNEGLRLAIAHWLEQRYRIPHINPQTQVLPVNGSREALFAFAQAIVDRATDAVVISPNPFYQIYEGAALLGRRAHPIISTPCPSNGFRMDFASVPRRHPAPHPIGVRVLARQPHRQGDGAGRLARAVRVVRALRFRDRRRRMLFRNLLRRSAAAARRAGSGAAIGPRGLRQSGGVQQPVQALQRAGHALRLRRRRCRDSGKIPAATAPITAAP